MSTLNNPTLKTLQHYWQAFLLNQEQSPLDSFIQAPNIKQANVASFKKSRLAIYTEGYKPRLIDVLIKTFPYLKKWLGEENFGRLALAYIEAYPSTYYNIQDIGQEFGIFLSTQDIPLAYIELANLEWALNQAYDAADHTVLTQNDLIAIPQEQWGNIIFKLHPSLHLVDITTNAVLAYQSLIRGEVAPAPLKLSTTEIWRIWQKDTQLYYLPTNFNEIFFLKAIKQNHTFGSICEKLEKNLPDLDVISYAVNQLLTWLQEGLLVKMEY